MSAFRWYDYEQGSEDWHHVRAGRVTASDLNALITPKKREVSATRVDECARRIVAETLKRGPILDPGETWWMRRGHELEPEALELFRLATGMDANDVGFAWSEGERLGASPDLWAPDAQAGVELKCPSEGKHIEYLLGDAVPLDYVSQVQSSMLVTGAPRWWFMSYFPGLPPLLLEVAPNGEELARIREAVQAVHAAKRAMFDVLVKRGTITEEQTQWAREAQEEAA